MRDLVTKIVIRAVDDSSRVIKGTINQLERLSKTILSLPSLFAAGFAGFSLARFFGDATQSAADFEQQMAKVSAVTNASAEDLAALRTAAEDAGASTKFTATQAAEGLENLARAGLSASEAIATLPDVLKLATAEGLSLAESAGFITQTLTQFGLGVQESGRVIDVLVKASQSANTDVRELGNALSYAALLAKDAGVSLEETTAILGKLADAGLQGERAGTALRSILAQLADPATKARQELAALGDTSGDLTTALETIRTAGNRGSAALLAFGVEAAPALRALVNLSKPALDELIETLQRASGSAEQAAAVMGNTFEGALTRLGSAWDSLKRTLLTPVLGPIADEADRLANSIGEFVQSGRLGKLQQALVSAFQNSADAAKNFFASFDFDKFVADLSGFVKSTTEALGTLTSVAGVAANTLTVAFNGLKSVVAGTRIALSYLKGDAEGVDNAFQDLEQATENARRAAQDLGIVGRDTADVIEVIKREAYDAAEAHERLNSVAYTTAKTLHQIKPAATSAGDALDAMGNQAENAAGGVQRLSSTTNKVKDDVEKSIGGITAAFDGSTESINKVTEGLKQTGDASQRANEATQDYGRTVEDVDKKQGKAAKGAQAYAEAIAGLITETRAQLAELSKTAAAVFDALLPDVVGSSITILNRNIQALGLSLRGANDESAQLKTQLEQAAEAADYFAERSQFAEPLSRAFYNVRLAAERVKEEFFSQRIALDDLLNRFDDLSESGGTGLDRLADRAERTARSFSLLSDADLEPLRQQIATVRDEMQRLEDQSVRTLDAIEERLLRARGDEVQLLALRYERERLQIEQQLQEAKRAGDKEAIQNLEEALSLLRELNKEESKKLKLRQQQDATRNDAESGSRTGNAPSGTGDSGARLGGNATGQTQVFVLPISELALQESILSESGFQRFIEPQIRRFAELSR